MRQLLRVVFFLFTISIFSQQIQSPSEFLGYELGTQFTRHHEVVDYYEYLAKIASKRVHLIEYGKTYERRPLLLAYVSSADNIQNLESIRTEHLKNTKGGGNSSKAIVWLSYNVHGNESVSTEASMQTIYELLTRKSDYLENTVVIIDPCINPDGRDRYVNWYNQYKNTPFTTDINSKEHHEGWWTGRSNHYMFDLNRDWAWLTQIESRHRLKQYNKWMPHVHVDFHEQGINNPYYFAPAAEPYHEVVTPFQRDFQATIGKNHATYFDAEGWFYFTKEVYDLFYPSYGDTYPTYNGSIGTTYEQGGSGRAGLGVINGIGDTLTLKDRIAHHHTTGLSSVEVSSKNAAKLNLEFKKFYNTKSFKYKSYVLSGNKDKMKALTHLLEQHEIDFGISSGATVKGFNYNTGKISTLRDTRKNLVVSTDQPKGTLVKVLFEPKAKLSDSLTYDITAWSLPYAYGLKTIASETKVSTNENGWTENTPKDVKLDKDTYAYVTDWKSMEDARFLSRLLTHNIRVRRASKPFKIEGKNFKRGSLIVTKGDNQNHTDFLGTLHSVLAENTRVEITAVKTGFVEKGKDFGSSHVTVIPKVKVALLAGEPTSTLRFGEIWHFFEEQLHYPLSVLDTAYLDRVDLSQYDILILPDGYGYQRFMDKKKLSDIKDWVTNGGKLIAMGGAIQGIHGEQGFGITTKTIEKTDTDAAVQIFEQTEREQIKEAITGAIFKTKVDTSHPLAYGYDTEYFTLKLGSDAYDYLDSGTVVYLDKNTKPVSGFAGSEAQKKIGQTLVFGVENSGRGNVVYMVDNPLFRGFWENGKLFFANALFMVP